MRHYVRCAHISCWLCALYAVWPAVRRMAVCCSTVFRQIETRFPSCCTEENRQSLCSAALVWTLNVNTYFHTEPLLSAALVWTLNVHTNSYTKPLLFAALVWTPNVHTNSYTKLLLFAALVWTLHVHTNSHTSTDLTYCPVMARKFLFDHNIKPILTLSC